MLLTTLATSPLAKTALDRPFASSGGTANLIAGQTVAFSVGDTTVCSGTTEAKGMANCSGAGYWVALAALFKNGFQRGFDATNAGSPKYGQKRASASHGGLF